jgi:type VI secretion system secreted protein Hcp
MATDAFLHLDGVTGESTDDAYKTWIEILSFSWGLSNPTTPGSATGGSGAGKVSLSDFSISKTLDSSSPSLFKNCCSGMHYATGTIKLRKAGGSQLVYLTYNLTQVFVSSYSIGSSGEVPIESVSFSCGSVQMLYDAQASTGKDTKPLPAGWSVITNKPI